MGSICQKFDNEPKIYSKKSSRQLVCRQGSLGCCDFQFTTKNVNSTTAECLLIFVDQHHHVQNNPFLNKDNKSDEHIGYKIQQYLDVYLEAHSLMIGESVILDVDILDLRVKSVAFLCINVWDHENLAANEDNILKREYEIYMEEILFKILQTGIRNLAVTQFNSQFGLPIQCAHKIIGRAIVFHGAAFRTISVLCHNRSSRIQQSSVVTGYENQYQNLLGNGFQFENSKGSPLDIYTPYNKGSLSSNYL